MNFRFLHNKIPSWLWFFLAIPTGIIGLLLYRGRQVKPVTMRSYIEPDSIPLNMAGEYHRANGGDKTVDEARMDFESPATANESSDIAAELRTGHQPPAPRSSERLRDEYLHVEEAARMELDDLKVIEGIGPAIAGLLRDRGITSFRQLAATPTDRLVAILTEARLNRLADPGTWPEQARLAAEGQWEALDALQRSLKGGRRIE